MRVDAAEGMGADLRETTSIISLETVNDGALVLGVRRRRRSRSRERWS